MIIMMAGMCSCMKHIFVCSCARCCCIRIICSLYVAHTLSPSFVKVWQRVTYIEQPKMNVISFIRPKRVVIFLCRSFDQSLWNNVRNINKICFESQIFLVIYLDILIRFKDSKQILQINQNQSNVCNRMICNQFLNTQMKNYRDFISGQCCIIMQEVNLSLHISNACHYRTHTQKSSFESMCSHIYTDT